MVLPKSETEGERRKTDTGNIWPVQEPHIVKCLQATLLSLTGSQEQSDFCPLEQRNILGQLCYTGGKKKNATKKRHKGPSLDGFLAVLLRDNRSFLQNSHTLAYLKKGKVKSKF